MLEGEPGESLRQVERQMKKLAGHEMMRAYRTRRLDLSEELVGLVGQGWIDQMQMKGSWVLAFG